MPGRNDPCPCKSGKKYKKCCLLKKAASSSVLPPKPRTPVLPSPQDLKLIGSMMRKYHDEQGFNWQENYDNSVADMDEPDESYTLEQHIRDICVLDVDFIAKHTDTANWTVSDWFHSLVANYYGSDHLEELDAEAYK